METRGPRWCQANTELAAVSPANASARAMNGLDIFMPSRITPPASPAPHFCVSRCKRGRILWVFHGGNRDESGTVTVGLGGIADAGASRDCSPGRPDAGRVGEACGQPR